jgi:Flp pilus assembly protein TadB
LTIAVILVLGILWVAVLVPPILRARGQQSRSDSVGDFHHKLRSLGQANGHRTRPRRTTASSPIFVPSHTGGSMSAQQKRRRDVLFVLLGLVAFTFFVAVLTRNLAFVALQIVADLALAGYLYLLLQYKQRAQDSRSKVRYLGASSYREPMPYMNGRYAPASSASDGPRLVPLRQTASH